MIVSLSRYFSCSSTKPGNLGLARPAPRRPEVQQHDFALSLNDASATSLPSRSFNLKSKFAGFASAMHAALSAAVGLVRRGGRHGRGRGRPASFHVRLPHERNADAEQRNRGRGDGNHAHVATRRCRAGRSLGRPAGRVSAMTFDWSCCSMPSILPHSAGRTPRAPARRRRRRAPPACRSDPPASTPPASWPNSDNSAAGRDRPGTMNSDTGSPSRRYIRCAARPSPYRQRRTAISSRLLRRERRRHRHGQIEILLERGLGLLLRDRRAVGIAFDREALEVIERELRGEQRRRANGHDRQQHRAERQHERSPPRRTPTGVRSTPSIGSWRVSICASCWR